MEARPIRNRSYDVLWLMLWGVLSSLWCLTAATRLSGTFDEPFYLEAGLESWHTGSNHRLMRAGTMPLPVDVQTLPLYLWERCRGEPFNAEADFGRLLPVARAANLIFWWLLLIYGWRLGNLFGGDWGGRLSVALLAVEPNLLAHASLATTDIPVTACLLALIYHFHAGRGGGWLRRVGVPSLWFGVALSAKASALTFGPLCMIALELHRLWQEGRLRAEGCRGIVNRLRLWWTATRELRRDLYWIIPLGLVFVFAYCGCDWKPQKSFVAWADKLPEGSLKESMTWLSRNLRIFPNAGEAIVYQIKHNVRGHGVYLFGDWQARAVWYYFPSALLLKLTIPVLTLLLLALSINWRSLFTPIGAAVLALLFFSLNCRVQIGIRLMLPLVSLLIVSLAVALSQIPPPRWSSRTQAVAAAGVLLAALVPAVTVWPAGLSFFNRLWGGPEAGFRYLSDSNYDWGQGLYELAAWQEQHPERPVYVWYFGADPRVKRHPYHLLKLHDLPLHSAADAEGLLRGKYLAVGASLRYGNPALTEAGGYALQALKQREPFARTSTFFIYDFSEPPSTAAP